MGRRTRKVAGSTISNQKNEDVQDGGWEGNSNDDNELALEKYKNALTFTMVGFILGCILSWLALQGMSTTTVPTTAGVDQISESCTGQQAAVDRTLTTYAHDERISTYHSPTALELVVFTPAECEQIIRSLDGVRLTKASIGETGKASDTDKAYSQHRRTSGASIGKNSPSFRWVYERIVNAVVKANKKYWKVPIAENIDSPLVELIQYQVYNSSDLGHYNWHIDVGTTDWLARRELSITIQLSPEDAYTGGGLWMRGGPTESQMTRKQGRAIVFPSYMLHRVEEVTTGVRRSMAIWFQTPIPNV